VAQAPRTRYAKCGDLDIAYQVFGDGPVDLVVLPGPMISIDSIDLEPSLYRFHRRLGSFARVIRFDHRGMGLSSRMTDENAMGPRFWANDTLAVMNAAGSEQATIFGSGFTAMSGFVLAADHPERVRSLVMVNGVARTLWASDYQAGAEVSYADPFRTLVTDPDAVTPPSSR
jgi:pimeloyl-ACP methyl ester carboxylesterase